MKQLREFFIYFFGQGEEIEFTNFGLLHLAPILTAAVIITLMYVFRDKLRNSKHEKSFRFAIAFIMIINEMSYFWRLVGVPSLGANPVDHLPITVCGWAVIFGSYMAVSKSQTLFDIVYFWLFAGSVFGILTPTVISFTGPTRFRFYQFWLEHLMGFIAVFYMIFVCKMRPNKKSIIKSYVAMAILAIIAYFANTLIGPGANYLFMAKPESTPSVLDVLPKNFALRLAIMAAAITFLYFLAYLPWLIKDIKAKKAEKLKELKYEYE